jgi:hypothetical protein
MHKIAVGLTTLLLTVAGTASGIAAETNTIEAAETAQLCNYCQDYTDAAMAAGPITTAYQVGVGYPQVRQPQELARREPAKVTLTPATTN